MVCHGTGEIRAGTHRVRDCPGPVATGASPPGPALVTALGEREGPARSRLTSRIAAWLRLAADSRVVVWGAAVAAAAAAALAGCHPTGTAVLDPLYSALFAGLVALACSRAARGTVLWAAMVATAFSRGWMIVAAVAALLVAFGGAFARRRPAAGGALAGALAAEAVLRWPSYGFQGGTALLGAAAVIPCLVGAWWGLPRRARRWVAAAAGLVVGLAVLAVVPLVLVGLAGRHHVANGISESKAALEKVSNGDAKAGVQQLDAAAADFSVVSTRLGGWWTAGAELVPVASQQRRALVVATSVAGDVARTAAQQASGIDYSQLRYSTGGINLSRLASLRPALQRVADQLGTALHQLGGIRSGWLVQPVTSRLALLDQQVAKADSSTSLALTAVRDAPGLLGADGTRRYLVAFMDTAESRGLGGIIASYAEVTATDGHLDLTSSGDVSQLNQRLASVGGGNVSGPAGFLDLYGSFYPHFLFQDLTYPPDLPTAADVISQLYAQSGHPPIDGVFVVDPRSLAALLQFTGPVQAGGLGQLTASNAEQVLTTGQYKAFPAKPEDPARLAALQSALTDTFSKLTSGSLPGPRTLGQVLGPEVRSGDLLFWTSHSSDQSLLDRTGLAGRFPSPAGQDLVSVITQNSANNKIDAYLQRTIDDKVSYDPATGQVIERLQIALHNEAPASGLPDTVIGSYPGSTLPKGTNLTWMNVYSPLQLGSARVDGRLVGLRPTPQYGVTSYSGFVEVPPGATVTVSLRLQGKLPPGSSYRITVHRQPMVRPDRMSVTVQASPGWAVTGPAAWNPDTASNSSHRFDFRRA